ncbi:MAG: hypothetical protein JO359_10040 [Candidatus Eremiobacteraeota bacterium]|nr:hypothetical protein [Candidatus Eremiobacteraeota bacterium]
MKDVRNLAFLGVGIGCAAIAFGAVAQAQTVPASGARWVCKEAGKSDTPNAALKDGSAQLVCREVYVTLKTASGKTVTVGNPMSKSGQPNKAKVVDMSKAADAQAQSDAASDLLAELGGSGGGG